MYVLCIRDIGHSSNGIKMRVKNRDCYYWAINLIVHFIKGMENVSPIRLSKVIIIFFFQSKIFFIAHIIFPCFLWSGKTMPRKRIIRASTNGVLIFKKKNIYGISDSLRELTYILAQWHSWSPAYSIRILTWFIHV